MAARSEKITFQGSAGALAARLDSPAGEPTAYALFAHCFTCSKDILAASGIARALTERGFAVLRFDFTGLGASEGEFANTNFSSNIEDLLRAVAWLRENRAAPSILIGHSLGGAAILAAAGSVPEARAVVTIAAPADAAHILESFAADLSTIEKDGAAAVTLAGRKFSIAKQFIDDVRAHSVLDRVRALRKPLLIFHAPRDATVSVDNAAQIFGAAKHPKSFVSLDDADHLLSRKEDSAYVASVLTAWVARYLPTAAPAPEPVNARGAVSMETGAGAFQQRILSGKHELTGDEPIASGGLDTGPSPYDFLAIALATCTAMTLRVYASFKGLKVPLVRVEVRHSKDHASDCKEAGTEGDGRLDRFERILSFAEPVEPALHEKLLEIADKCPVHKTLDRGARVVTRLDDVTPP